jgi:dGTPase
MMEWTSLLSAQRKPGEQAPGPHSSRSAFEQDYDRIIFSHAFRRLQDKTQVHPIPEHDFVHNRLTHSLEVSSVARSLGKRCGEILLQRNPNLAAAYSLFDIGAITSAAALAHDLGNPPFGHAGEVALSDFFLRHPLGQSIQKHVTDEQWAELISFEGNAQGFRLLHQSGRQGVPLTFASLAAFTKYPRTAQSEPRYKERRSQKKYGLFQSEKEAYRAIAEALGLIPLGTYAWCRHPLAFLVEAADDICYSIVDLEDGCRLGLVSFDETVALLADILRQEFDRAKLERSATREDKIAVLRAMAIGRLITECVDVFVQNEAELLAGRFDTALLDVIPAAAAMKQIAAVSVEKIYRARPVVEKEVAGFEVLPGLVEEFIPAGLPESFTGKSAKRTLLRRLLPDTIRALAESETDSYTWVRHLLDYLSGMTDRHAVSLYRKVKGHSM